MSTPREDVFLVAALLDALREVMAPRTSPELVGTPLSEPLPPLPPDQPRKR
ncbi:MAG: hypothetical protein ACI8S6_002450 [Myxococcota bacterium]